MSELERIQIQQGTDKMRKNCCAAVLIQNMCIFSSLTVTRKKQMQKALKKINNNEYRNNSNNKNKNERELTDGHFNNSYLFI